MMRQLYKRAETTQTVSNVIFCLTPNLTEMIAPSTSSLSMPSASIENPHITPADQSTPPTSLTPSSLPPGDRGVESNPPYAIVGGVVGGMLAVVAVVVVLMVVALVLAGRRKKRKREISQQAMDNPVYSGKQKCLRNC